jgi:hypothetical protein
MFTTDRARYNSPIRRRMELRTLSPGKSLLIAKRVRGPVWSAIVNRERLDLSAGGLKNLNMSYMAVGSRQVLYSDTAPPDRGDVRALPVRTEPAQRTEDSISSPRTDVRDQDRGQAVDTFA